MAIDGKNLNGAFPIYNTSGPVNYYVQNAAKMEAKRLAEQKALQEELSKVKIDGVRDADRPEYINKYNEWKNMSYAIGKEKNLEKKAQLRSEFDKKFFELQDLVNDSKQLLKGEEDFTKVLLTKDRDNYADDVIERFQKAKTLPRKSPGYVRDLSTYERTVDTSKVDDQFRQIDADLLRKAKEQQPVAGARLKAGNRMGTNMVFNKVVDPKEQAYNYGLAYDTNRDIKYSIRQTYKDLFDKLPEAEAKTQAIADMVAKRKLEDPRNQFVLDESEDNWKEKALFRAMLSGSQGSVNEQLEARKRFIKDVQQFKPDAAEKLGAFISGNPQYSTATKFAIKRDKDHPNDNNYFVLDIPAKVKLNAKGEEVIESPRQEYKLNRKDPNFEIRMNEVINGVTGQKMDVGYSIGLTGNQKGTTKKVTPSKSSKSTVTMILPNGTSGEIPADKVEAFMKKYPKAKRQ